MMPRRDMSPPPGPVPGRKYPPLTHADADATLINGRFDNYDIYAKMGRLRTTPTPGQMTMLLAERGVGGGGARPNLDWITQDAFDALERKAAHLARMPGRSPEWNPWMLHEGSEAHMPPPDQRPNLPPLDVSGPGFDARKHSWQELIDALAVRRQQHLLNRGIFGGVVSGLRGGTFSTMGDDELLGS